MVAVLDEPCEPNLRRTRLSASRAGDPLPLAALQRSTSHVPIVGMQKVVSIMQVDNEDPHTAFAIVYCIDAYTTLAKAQ